VVQNKRLRACDDAANKIFELLFGLVLLGVCADVLLAHPDLEDTSNPDILATINGRRWGFACKVIYGASGKTLFDNLKKGVEQIEVSSAEIGCVMLNLRNVLDHDIYWPILNREEFRSGAEPIFAAYQNPEVTVGDKLRATILRKRDQADLEVGRENILNLFSSKKALPAFLAFCQTCTGKLSAIGPVPTSIIMLGVGAFSGVQEHLPIFEAMNQALHERSHSAPSPEPNQTISANVNDWAEWESKTDFRQRVRNLAEKHRGFHNLTPEAYLTSKHAELARELADKTIIYLDTKHWVNLCNVVVQSKKLLPIYDEILGRLEHLRQRGRICCPISSPLFWELMKQKDDTTRQVTARIMDYFSGGVCLQNWLDLAKAEFANHVCRTFAIAEADCPKFSFWTKCGFWVGEHTFKFPELAAENGNLLEKVYIDLRWDLSLEHYQAMPDWTPTPDSFAAAWVKEAESAQARQIQNKSSYNNLVQQRRRQLLSALTQQLLPMLALCRNVSGSPDDHVASALDPIYDGRDPQALPSLEVVAALDAAISQEANRKVQANDMLDYLHAAQALPNCDALFCDNFMAQKLRNKPLEFGKTYGTEIGSRPEEILQFLKGLN
jgi:hypothetical protein